MANDPNPAQNQTTEDDVILDIRQKLVLGILMEAGTLAQQELARRTQGNPVEADQVSSGSSHLSGRSVEELQKRIQIGKAAKRAYLRILVQELAEILNRPEPDPSEILRRAIGDRLIR